MIFYRHAAFEIVGHHHIYITQGQPHAVGLAHDADAPVDVGRQTVLRVVLQVLGQVGAGIEGLMADEHAVAERAPRQPCGRLQPAMTQEAALLVDDVGQSVEHGRQLGARQLVQVAPAGYLLQRIRGRKGVARVHIDDIVAHDLRQAFVHRVVDALVRLRLDDDLMSGVRLVRLLLVSLHDLERLVSRRPVDDEMLHVLIGLAEHAVEGPLDDGRGVISDGDNRESRHSLKCLVASAC